jgi:hypothetical protein
MAAGRPLVPGVAEPVGKPGPQGEPDSAPFRRAMGSDGQGPLAVGIDLSKAPLGAHVLPAGEIFVVDGDAVGSAILIRRLEQLPPLLVAVEATGGLESVVVVQLGAAGWPVVVVNPAHPWAFAQVPGSGYWAGARRRSRSTPW